MSDRPKFAVIAILLAVFVPGAGAASADDADPSLAAYLRTLESRGREPLQLVIEALDRHDLVLFDDALHTAAEPWDFYQRLVRSPEFRSRARFVFFETLSINHQRHIDAYLASDPEDMTLLAPMFQDDYAGRGWNLRTHLDLLRTIREVNLELDESERLRVVAVSNPVYWEGMHDAADIELMRKALIGRDHLMYRVILSELDGFRSGRKGIFLTNTRHAYTGIRDRQGTPYWNTGTFFRQWHPGKTWSIRFHNVALHVERRLEPEAGQVKTTAGMERMEYRWVRMGEGIWDRAFREFGDRPVGLALADTPFGREDYVGNHMADAAPGQTMADAYDGLIFLAPLEQLHTAATFDFIYTEAFRQEMQRRYRMLHTESQLQQRLAAEGAADLAELIAKETRPHGRRRVLDTFDVKPIEAP